MGSSTMIYKLVSSAKSLIEELMSSTMSLVYKKKSRGPRIEPCGTPAFTEVQEELAPGKTTFFPCHLDNQRTFLVDGGREDSNTTISGSSSARQRNAVQMAFNDGPTLNAGLLAL